LNTDDRKKGNKKMQKANNRYILAEDFVVAVYCIAWFVCGTGGL
jgi:hypothetical protein